MHASVGAVSDTTRRDSAELVSYSTLDNVNQFIAHVPMQRQVRAGFESCQSHLALGRGV
jgi:hypothetical protein